MAASQYYSTAANKKLQQKQAMIGADPAQSSVPAQNQRMSQINNPADNTGVVNNPVVTPTGANTSNVPTGSSLDSYIKQLTPNYSKMGVPELNTAQGYTDLAKGKLSGAFATKLAGLLSNYNNLVAGYGNQATQTGLNFDAQIASNDRNTMRSKNNYSDATLGRGLGRSTIATTGLGELDSIGARINDETNGARTAALNAIEAMKQQATQNYGNEKQALDFQNASDEVNLAQELMNQDQDRRDSAMKYNSGQDGALMQAALGMYNNSVDNETQRYGYDKAYDKSLDTQQLKGDTALTIADVNNAVKQAVAELQARTSTANNIRTTTTSSDNNKRTTKTSSDNNKRTTSTSAANNKRTTATSAANNIRTTNTSKENNIRTTNTSASNTAARIAASKATAAQKAAQKAKDNANKWTSQGLTYKTDLNTIANTSDLGSVTKKQTLDKIKASIVNDAKLKPTEKQNLIKSINAQIEKQKTKQRANTNARIMHGGS